MKYVLAIDGGSQSTKLVIFDLNGNIVCEASEPLKPMDLPKLGWVEHPDDDLYESLVLACKKLMKKFDGNKDDIMAAGLCSIRFDRVYSKKDGHLAQQSLSWMDERVSKPYEHTNDKVAYITSTNGYLTRRLTDEKIDTVATYQGVWPIDTDKWAWSEDKKAYEDTGMPRKMLFDLKMPGEIVGIIKDEIAEELGLPKNLPIVATANDKAVEALGTGAFGDGLGLISLGTYICGMVHGDSNPKDCKNFWVNFACMPNRYLYESTGVRRGMWLISWYKKMLGKEVKENAEKHGIKAEEYLEKLAEEVPAGSDGLLIVPEWLPPTGAEYKRGVMIGFDARHGQGHIYRAIMEAIAMSMKNNMDAMCEELNISLKQLTLSGGGSNSKLFLQIFADVFGVPVVRNEVNGAAAVGSAICAAVAAGGYNTFDEAANAMIKIRDVTTPIQENVKVYEKINKGVYKDITKYTDEILKKSQEVFNDV